jgi:hypothetical protein
VAMVKSDLAKRKYENPKRQKDSLILQKLLYTHSPRLLLYFTTSLWFSVDACTLKYGVNTQCGHKAPRGEGTERDARG